MGSFVRNKSILTIVTLGTLLTVATMAVYKIAVRTNGADVPPPQSSSTSAAPEQNNEKATVSTSKQFQQISTSPKPPSSSSAANMAKFTEGQTFTPEYRQQHYHKTVHLIAARAILSKKLSRGFSQKAKFSHKLLDRHYRLKNQESKHLAARTRLLAELQKEYKANPCVERAKDVRLVRKLLRSFKHHLKGDTYSHKYRSSRPSAFRSISTSPSSSEMDDHENGVSKQAIAIAAEQLALEMTAAGGSARKRRASQRSNASLATLFAEDQADQTGGENDGAVAGEKQTKKPKLDLDDGQKPPVAVDAPPKTPTNPFILRKETKVDTSADEKESKGDAPAEENPEPDLDSEQKLSAAEPSTGTQAASEKEEKTEANLTVPPSPKTPVLPSKEERGSIASPVTASPSSSKKHPLDSDVPQSPRIKKAKVDADSTSMTPAVPATSPKKPISTKAIVPKLPYHQQAVYNMLNDPLGYDDLVYDDPRPIHKRPKFGYFGQRIKRLPPNVSPMMSGGIGSDVAEDTAPVPLLNKPQPKEKEGRLSEQVLKKNHHDKVNQVVREGRAAMASQQKSRVDGLTEKGKYSVNKEARYENNNKNKNNGNAGSSPRKNNGNNGFKGGNGNKSTNVSAARRQSHAVRSRYGSIRTGSNF
ncbi:hypothetical protein V8F20_006488 [Naviculisporaceae sp. PSN 640]